MNFTMVIADDEPLVLKSLEMLVAKNFPNIQVAGLAENGVELKELLERLEPDLAVVDIRMPGLSGIEVIELMRGKGCKTRFIINTAFSDFEYVKKALDLKTDGYILKPGKQDEKIRAISELCRAVEAEREKNSRQSNLDSALQVVNPYLGSEILMSIFSEKCDEEHFKVYLDINGLHFSGGCIATFLIRRPGRMGARELNGELGKILAGICGFLATVTSDGIVVLLFAPGRPDREEQRSWCAGLAKLIAQDLMERTGSECLYGVGLVYASFSDMPRSYQESIAKLRENHKDLPDLPADNADKIKDYVETAKQYIDSNYIRDISLMACAESVGISPYYLSHIFKEKTGSTFVEYLTAVRMDRAKELCRNPKLTVKDISDRCGYINTTYFCKVFKRNVGKTIGAYRMELLRTETERGTECQS